MPFNKRNPLSQPLSLNLSLKQKPLHTAQPGQSSLSAAQPRLAWSLLMRLPAGPIKIRGSKPLPSPNHQQSPHTSWHQIQQGATCENASGVSDRSCGSVCNKPSTRGSDCWEMVLVLASPHRAAAPLRSCIDCWEIRAQSLLHRWNRPTLDGAASDANSAAGKKIDATSPVSRFAEMIVLPCACLLCRSTPLPYALPARDLRPCFS